MNLLIKVVHKIILFLIIPLSIVACGGGGGGNNESESQNAATSTNLSKDTPFAYVERSIQKQSASNLEKYKVALESPQKAPLDIASPYEFNPGAKLYTRSSLDVDALDEDVLSSYFGSSDFDVKDLNVSADGETLIFAAHGPAGNSSHSSWSIYEYDFQLKSIRRLIADDTLANTGQDTSPSYTNSGRIVFSSDRAAGNPDSPIPNIIDEALGEDCHKVGPTEKPSLLHSMTLNGEEILQLTYGNNHDIKPTTLKDGRIAFIRWSKSFELLPGCSAASLTKNFSKSGAEEIFGSGYPAGLKLPNKWSEDDRCAYSQSTPVGQVVASNHYTLLRITEDGKEIDQLYETVSSDSSDEEFISVSKIIQAENGHLVALIQHHYNQFLGGNILELQEPGSLNDERVFTNFAPESLIQGGVNIYPNQLSVRGWYSSISPYWDGSSRLLVSWAQCSTIENGVNSFCEADTVMEVDGEMDTRYGVWVFNPKTDSRLPIVRAKRDTVYSDLALSQAHKGLEFPFNPYNSEFVDNTDLNRIVCKDPEPDPICEYGGVYPDCNPAPSCEYGGEYPNCDPAPICEFGGVYPDCNPAPSCEFGGVYPDCNPAPSCEFGGVYPDCNPAPSCEFGGVYPDCDPAPSCEFGGVYPDCDPAPSCEFGGVYPDCDPAPSCEFGGVYPDCDPEPSCEFGGVYPDCDPEPSCEFGGVYPDCDPEPSCEFGGVYPDCDPEPSCEFGGVYPDCDPAPSCEFGGVYPDCDPEPSCEFGGVYPDCDPEPSCEFGGVYPDCDPEPSCEFGGVYPDCDPAPSCEFGGVYPDCDPEPSCEFGGVYPDCDPEPTCEFGGEYPDCEPEPTCEFGGEYPDCEPEPTCEFGGEYPDCEPEPTCEFGGEYPDCEPEPTCEFGGVYPDCDPEPTCEFGGEYPDCEPEPTCEFGGEYPDCDEPNQAPIANAGEDKNAFTNEKVTLDGSASSDPDGDSLLYQWNIIGRPDDSTAELLDSVSVAPSFTPDVVGSYLIELKVNDGNITSEADTVTVSVEFKNTAPTANAGEDISAHVNDNVRLDGSNSHDPEGDSLSYQWSLISSPKDSLAELSNAQSVTPSITPDAEGDYVVELVVNDGEFDSEADTLLIKASFKNRAPTANAGNNQSGTPGKEYTFSGELSFDPDGDDLSYTWELIEKPDDSVASLSDANDMNSSFDADAEGDYVLQLIVSDGELNSEPDLVQLRVETPNQKPIANAGEDRPILIGDQVTLDGSGSSDPDGDALTYQWTVLSPASAVDALSDATAVTPSLDIAERENYIIQLVVNDGELDSDPDTINLTVGNVKPVADAGDDQTAGPGDTIQLDGSGSSDLDGDSLSYTWTIIEKPEGSLVELNDSNNIAPSFTADQYGTYKIQLVVNDGIEDSEPDVVVIDTFNTRPVANAGNDKTPCVGDIVWLDGRASYDADGDPLSYQWSIISSPEGSTSDLSGSSNATASIEIDVAGEYVVQLIVNDGIEDSEPDTVLITTQNGRPIAEAGDPQTVNVDNVVGLDGSLSRDPDGDTLTYAWTIISEPEGSQANLLNDSSITPTLFPDEPGVYVIQLIVNDGVLDSLPDTVEIEVKESVCEVSTATRRSFPVTIRDFQSSHPDFEHIVGVDYGIVDEDLGHDGLPVYANAGGKTKTTNGVGPFNQWYRTVDGVNIEIPMTFEMTRDSDSTEWEYQNGNFFPIDGMGWGNTPGWDHNYHFTLEAHLEFDYEGGEEFTFRGDDDLWVFINGKLAIDIGGVHSIIQKSVKLDEVADMLGIEKGKTYTFDLFFAERHVVASNFMFQTNINLECVE